MQCNKWYKNDETYFDGIHIDVLSKIEDKGIFNDTEESSKVAQKGPNINHFQKGSFWPIITEITSLLVGKKLTTSKYHLDPLKRAIIDKKVVPHSPILAGNRSGLT